MSFIRKNKKNIFFLTIIVLLLLTLLFTWLQNKVLHNNNDIACNVYPLQLNVGDSLHYVDNTPFATSRKWDFGDGGSSLADSGIYHYTKAGYYQVRILINNKFLKYINIKVLDTVAVSSIEDSLALIDAPDMGMQFENIVFRTRVKNATAFRWKFGETGNIDSKEPMAIYSFQKPGSYTVMLYTNTTQYPVQHKITILPAFKAVNDSISSDNTYGKIDDDFKYHLQQIANGSRFNEHYNYLLKTYLCQNEKAVMKINGSKMNDFNSYCLGLQFDKNVIIQSAKVGFDNEQKCVTKVEVQQGK